MLVSSIFGLVTILVYKVFPECGNACENKYQYLTVNEISVNNNSSVLESFIIDALGDKCTIILRTQVKHSIKRTRPDKNTDFEVEK